MAGTDIARDWARRGMLIFAGALVVIIGGQMLWQNLPFVNPGQKPGFTLPFPFPLPAPQPAVTTKRCGGIDGRRFPRVFSTVPCAGTAGAASAQPKTPVYADPDDVPDLDLPAQPREGYSFTKPGETGGAEEVGDGTQSDVLRGERLEGGFVVEGAAETAPPSREVLRGERLKEGFVIDE